VESGLGLPAVRGRSSPKAGRRRPVLRPGSIFRAPALSPDLTQKEKILVKRKSSSSMPTLDPLVVAKTLQGWATRRRSGSIATAREAVHTEDPTAVLLIYFADESGPRMLREIKRAVPRGDGWDHDHGQRRCRHCGKFCSRCRLTSSTRRFDFKYWKTLLRRSLPAEAVAAATTASGQMERRRSPSRPQHADRS